MDPQDNVAKRDNHTPSCAVCQKRKVRCNRVYPCAACTKSGLDCHFPPPGTHGKRKRRNTGYQSVAQEPIGAPRIDLFAERPTGSSSSFKTPVASTNEFPSPESTGSQSTVSSIAKLVSEGNGYRYVNNHLWSAISTDPHTGSGSSGASPENCRPSPAGSRSGNAIYEGAAKAGDGVNGGRSFVFGGGPSSSSQSLPSVIQVPPSQIVFLCQTYQTNVDPVMKISHAPSVQSILLGQIGRPVLPSNEQALAVAIYFISVVSMTDEQCQESLHDSRASLILKHREATEVALSAADFITTTDIVVLQALVLYLAALRSLGEIQKVWSLLGIAIRIAGTLGLSRDGSSFGLSPFDTEMRRRLWWGIVYFDGRMAEVLGQDGDLMGNNFDAGAPSNLNDVDLFPTMARLPEAQRAPTEAVYLQARVLSVTVARSLQSITGPQGTWHRLHDSSMSTSEKLGIMHRIEQRYNQEILEPCDPTVPLQWLSINTAKTFATKLRLIARIPIVDPEKEWEDTSGFSQNAFILSMDLLQIQLDLWCEPSVQQWKWHWQAHFQWYALVTLLRQTRLRQSGQGASRAWSLIRKAFDIIIPSLELGPRKSHLLDGIHALLNAAKRQHDQSDQTGMSGSELNAPQVGNGGSSSTPGEPNPSNGFSSGYGPRPHTAMLPGTDIGQQTPPPGNFGRSMLNDPNDPVLGFDIEAIDWVEFDRLATELCQQ